jgi:hypothetical protein
MSDGGQRPGSPGPLDRTRYELDFEDTLDGEELDETHWLPHYLPHWSSREATASRYRLGDGYLRLRIEADQPPWCPEFDGRLVVRGPAQRAALHAAIRPVGAARQGARRPPEHVVDWFRAYRPLR